MARRKRYLKSFNIILLLLFVVAVSSLWQVTTPRAFEQLDKNYEKQIVNPSGLQIKDGAVTGRHINNQPLGQVLDTMSRQEVFEYQGHDDLLNQPVSGSFEGIPIIDMMKEILRPFNYYLIKSKETGNPLHVYIVSLKGELTVPENTAPGDLLAGLE